MFHKLVFMALFSLFLSFSFDIPLPSFLGCKGLYSNLVHYSGLLPRSSVYPADKFKNTSLLIQLLD